MIDRSDSVTIHRRVEEVFAYVTDTSHDPAWHTDILEVRKQTGGPIGVGTKWHMRFKPFMGHSEGNMDVVAFEPNRTEVLRAVMGPMQPTLTYLFEPGNGGTRFTRHVQIKVSGMMRLMVPFMQWIDTPRRNRRFLSNLKRVLEENPS